MTDILEACKRVYEEGTVLTKTGKPVAKRHVLDVIAAAHKVITEGTISAAYNFTTAKEGSALPESVTGLFESSIGRLLPEERVTDVTAEIIRDIACYQGEKLKTGTIGFTLDISHYEAQFERLARQENLTVSWDEGFRPSLREPAVAA